MVYLHRKLIKEKAHFYLRESQSTQGKIVTKDLLYLGVNPANFSERLHSYKQLHPQIRIPHSVRRVMAKYKQEREDTVASCVHHWHRNVQSFDQESKLSTISRATLELMNAFSTASPKTLHHLIYKRTTPLNLQFNDFLNLLNLLQQCEQSFITKKEPDSIQNIFEEQLLLSRENFQKNNDLKKTILEFNARLAEQGIPGIIIDSRTVSIVKQAFQTSSNQELTVSMNVIYARMYWRCFL